VKNLVLHEELMNEMQLLKQISCFAESYKGGVVSIDLPKAGERLHSIPYLANLMKP